MTLAEAMARADELAGSGAAQDLAALRTEWDDELEAAARSADFREQLKLSARSAKRGK